MIHSLMWFQDQSLDVPDEAYLVSGVHDGMDISFYGSGDFRAYDLDLAHAIASNSFTAILHGPATAQQWSDFIGDSTIPYSSWGGGGNRW